MKKVYAFIVDEVKRRVTIGKKADVLPLVMPGQNIKYADTIDHLLGEVKALNMEIVVQNPTKALSKAFNLVPQDAVVSEKSVVAHDPAPIVPVVIKKFFMRSVTPGVFAVHVVTDRGVKIIDKGPLSEVKNVWMSYVKDRSLLMARLQEVAG